MTLICTRMASAPIQRTLLLALPLALILAACSGRGQTATVPHATEGYGSGSPPLVSQPRGALRSYDPYERLTDQARRSNLQ
jgi:hypothetical protein